MRMERGYCIKCHKETVHVIKTEAAVFYYHKGKADEIAFPYDEKVAYCRQCGEQVYSRDVNDENCDERERIINLHKASIAG